ncbi:MAG: hypothetical protein DRO39_07250 [Thermoprotei archaeon]|nr:MAG: hypothetical protein DRO39_07250 [Thermoprotei archaeon]
MAQTQIVVNVWITKSTPWTCKIYDPIRETLDDMPDCDHNLNEIINMLQQLPVRVALPKHFSVLSLPRYYLIVIDNDRIVDVIGIRRNKTPTKWSYRLGYWHPIITRHIIDAIARRGSNPEKKRTVYFFHVWPPTGLGPHGPPRGRGWEPWRA